MSRQNMFYWQSDRPFSVEEIKSIFLARKDDYSKIDMQTAAEHASGEKLSKLHEPIGHGSVNIVCPFITQSGREGVIRAHPRQVKNEYFYAEREAMKAAKSVGVKVPSTWLVDDSRTIVPFDYIVTDLLPGKVLKDILISDPSSHAGYLEGIGRQLGLLHRYRTNGYGFFDNDKAKDGVLIGIHASNEDHFSSALESDEKFHFENSQHIAPALTKKAISFLKNHISAAHCDQPTIVHNDIADWNTVVGENGVTGILDWDECFSGDPVFDFATMSLFYTDEQMQLILTGYQQTNQLPKDYDDKFPLYLTRYIISKSKIAIKQLNSRQNDFMKLWLANAVEKLSKILN